MPREQVIIRSELIGYERKVGNDHVIRVGPGLKVQLPPLAGKHGLPTNIVMVYGPRDEGELAIVEALARASHAGACLANDSSRAAAARTSR